MWTEPEGPVDNPSTHIIPMGIAYLDTTRSRPIHQDPFMRIYFTKNIQIYQNTS